MVMVGRGNHTPREVLEQVLELVRGGMFVHDAAKVAGVNADTLWKIARRDPEGFGAEFTQARYQCAHVMAEQSVSLLDKASADDVEDPKRASAHVNLVTNRSKARQWLAGKWAPDTYGEKIEHRGQVTQAVTIMLPPLEPLPRQVASRVVPQVGAGSETAPSETPEAVAEVLPDDG